MERNMKKQWGQIMKQEVTVLSRRDDVEKLRNKQVQRTNSERCQSKLSGWRNLYNIQKVRQTLPPTVAPRLTSKYFAPRSLWTPAVAPIAFGRRRRRAQLIFVHPRCPHPYRTDAASAVTSARPLAHVTTRPRFFVRCSPVHVLAGLSTLSSSPTFRRSRRLCAV